MNVYGTKQIRNVVLLGHGGAGKTTVAEALALVRQHLLRLLPTRPVLQLGWER